MELSQANSNKSTEDINQVHILFIQVKPNMKVYSTNVKIWSVNLKMGIKMKYYLKF